jgi:RNA polymerase sigma-70 factor (ECF subfamily)
MQTLVPVGAPAEEVLGRLLGRRAWLLSYIRALVQDYALAEDVFQEVCLALLRRGGEVTPGRGLEGYFLKAARHAALAALEERGRAAPLSPGFLETLDEAWSFVPEPADPGRLNALRRCIERLQERARRLLRLRYDELLSGRTLAERIGTSTQGAYVALSRVHRALRKCVTAEGGASP